ncbi:MAG: branched-chain amino acid ABC transporter permease [Polyangiaceae bacterium]|nr:branched-chain amino acid ABC transporter permease [Polyangiaceae bacterium]
MSWVRRGMSAVLVVLALYAFQEVANHFLIEYVVRILMLAGINIILAVGLNLINGTTGQFSIGHAGFMAVGAYAAAFSGVQMRPTFVGWFGESLAEPMVFNVALLIGAVFAGVTGILVGIPSLRLKGDYLAIVTLGFGEIIRIFFTNQDRLGAATGYFGDGSAGLPAYTTPFWVFLWAFLVTLLVSNLTSSQIGRTLRAIREDEIAAESIGVQTTRLKVTAFAVSAALAGIAGGLFAHMQAGVRPDDFKFEKSVDMLVMIIVGGLGSITGAVLGGVFLAVTLEAMRDLQEYRLILYACLLVVIMIVRPQGILGQREFSLRALLGGKPRREPTA